MRELRGDLGGRQISHLDVEARDRAAIIPRAARLDQRQAGAREEASAFSCRRPFDGTAMTRGALIARLRRRQPLDPDREADRGNGLRAPSRVSMPS